MEQLKIVKLSIKQTLSSGVFPFFHELTCFVIFKWKGYNLINECKFFSCMCQLWKLVATDVSYNELF